MSIQTERSRRRNSIVIQGAILGAAAVIVRIIGLLYRVPLTRILTDEGAGYYSSAYTIYMLFLMVSSYGIPAALAKLVAAQIAVKHYLEAHRIFKAALWMALIFGLLSSVGMYVFAEEFATLIIRTPNAKAAIQALAPALFFYALLAVFRGYFQGMNTMMPTAISQIVEQILNAAFSLLLGYMLVKQSLPLGAAGGTMGTGIGALAGLVFMVFIYGLARNRVIHKKIAKDTYRFEDVHMMTYWKVILRTSIPIVLGSVVLQLASMIDLVLFQRALQFNGLSEALAANYYGVYTMKVKVIIRLPITVAFAIGVASLPAIATSMALGEVADVKEKIQTALKTTLLIVIPSAVGIMILATPILRLFFGDQNLALGAQALKLGAITIIFNGAYTVSIAILQGLGLLRRQVIICLVGLVVKVGADALFLYVFDWQINGAVMADNLFTFALIALSLHAIQEVLPMHWDYRGILLKPLIASSIMGLVAFLTYHGFLNITGRPSVSVVLAVLIALPAYGVPLLLLKTLTSQELMDYPKGTALLKLFRKLKLMS